jgi:cell wall-associated NlpC family hydrolase
LRDSLFAVKASFAAAQADRERLLAGLKGEIAALVAQQEAAKHAAEVQDFDPNNLPPVGGGAGAAVAYAKAQLGKPYEYGAAGPNSFDCSGLTMAAWAQAGVGMPHNSESQYNKFPHVPMSQLQPGDILWRPDHVGIYVGGGMAIHATHPGDVVRYISASYFQGAARPG